MSKIANQGTYRWLSEPRWYLWEGGFFLIARADGVVPAHAHHAIQIVVAVDGEVAICGQGEEPLKESEEWRKGPGVIVQPDAVHSFNCNGALGAMLFVDPESAEGTWLGNSLKRDITIVSGPRLASAAQELRMRRGQVLARVGCSGDAREPHLHFQVTDSPKLMAGEGLPYLIDRYQSMNASGGSPEVHVRELPLNHTIAVFGEERGR